MPDPVPETYFNEGDLAARVGGSDALTTLIHDDGATEDDDAAVLSELIDGVCEEADGFFIAGGYPVPLDGPLIPKVKNTLLDIAAYRAKTRGNREATDGETVLFKAAMFRLGQIGAQLFLLSPATAPSSADVYTIDSEKGLFSRPQMRGW